ncbi:hypothetical protein PN36_17395 [Candidatus Thiomargarita nelsonii]|uniref:Uncharacterized protein n=1 Tax=Candidatus Thiomargarita nelsonii TaxID=1003181 RepID=A0A4E0QUX2_9GAMM|nr:hypothetical protein PN36_17395 [Candidatus Thiomargarita nelsonii]
MMNKPPFDLKSIETALQKYLFETPDPDESVRVLLENPQLLTDFVDKLFGSLIEEAAENENLVKFYQGRRLLLQTVKESISKKNLALLLMIKQIESKKEKLAKTMGKPFEFQDILDKVQTWLEAPTREKGVSILQQNPELLTDQPERMFSHLIDEAQQHGNKFFVRILRTLSEFFRVIRLEVGANKTASKDELKKAVEYALDHTDFSVFVEGKQPAIFIA